jgi:RNA-directed DNA polymerase
VTDLDRLKTAKTLTDLALILGFTPKGLSHTLYVATPATRFRTFEIPKADGTMRTIDAPVGAQKLAQRNLADLLQACRSEIDATTGRRPLSHGFRPGRSILTNARLHTGRRYVLNLDLEDFFPTFNFGRVRGFFIKDEHFALHPAVATVIAQIACWNNGLPQGGPSSPIISDLIAHILDARLVRLAKAHKATYSRYADDLTFSTNRKDFPTALALTDEASAGGWALGDELVQAIQSRGFAINPAKTRMQVRASRQMVTGLTVNRKVNVTQEYYRSVRAMCHALFNSGVYHRPALAAAPPIAKLSPLEGMLTHIYHVKRSSDVDHETGKVRKNAAQGTRNLYARFLFYKWFIALEKPLVVCEGSTDGAYLRFALRHGTGVPPSLGEMTATGFEAKIRFFSYSNKVHRLGDVRGGADNITKFIKDYKRNLARYNHRPLAHPVILLVDNDQGATGVFAVAKKLGAMPPPTLTSKELFYHLTDNLYLIKTTEIGASGISCIEDLFDGSLKNTVIDGKTFNGSNKIDHDTEYDKQTLLEKVVSPAASSHDWTAFMPLLDRIAAVIAHHKVVAPAGAMPAVAAAT